MKRLVAIALCGLLAGCMSKQPWRGFLDTERVSWRQYLDQTIDVNVTDKPVDQVVQAPLFPDFNCIVNLGGEPSPAGEPFAEPGTNTDQRLVFTLSANGISRREVLWRIAKQCGLDMSIARDDTGKPRAVLIRPKKKDAEPGVRR